MLTRAEYAAAQSRAASLIRESGIYITDKEAKMVEVADFGLSRLDMEGAQILTLVATDRIAVKIIVLFPNQKIPEHWHPRVGEDQVRMREGLVLAGQEDAYIVRHELILKPGDQINLQPGTKHWFQAGEKSAVMYSFSTVARDVLDCFTDPHIERVTRIQE